MLIDAILLSLVVLVVAALVGHWQRDRYFTIAMLVYGLFVSLVSILSISDSVIGPAWVAPYLAVGDGQGYYIQAQLLQQEGILNFQTLIRSNYLGYQILLAMVFEVFGTSLTAGVTANLVMLLLSIACLYRATFLLTKSNQAARLACIAAMLTTAHVSHAVLLLKEPVIGLSFALILLAGVKVVAENRISVRTLLYVVIALAIVISMRATALLALFVAFATIAKFIIRKRLHAFVGLVAIMALSIPFAQQFTIYQLDVEFISREITENTVISDRFGRGDLDVSGIAGRLGGIYIALPFLLKIVFAPIAAALQFLLPFDFWSDLFIEDHFSAFLSRNLNVIWMLFVGPWFIYASINILRIESPLVSRFLLAGIIYYFVIAIIYGGLIPRYVGPALFWIYPAIGYWWDRFRREGGERARVMNYFTLYYAAFTMLGLLYIVVQVM